MNVTIRKEQPRDHHLVERITREAFWNLYCPGCIEHHIVHTLRNHPDFIPELSFVIELDGEIVGSIFYSRSKIVAPDGTEHAALTFGPVSILPRHHRKGLGRRLITHSISEAKKLGHRAILIGGYPYHYAPYGFEGAKKYGISMPDGNYYTGIMALPLYEGALAAVTGSLYFSPALEPGEAPPEDYERMFPEKEKAVLPSQAEFETAVAEIDTREWSSPLPGK